MAQSKPATLPSSEDFAEMCRSHRPQKRSKGDFFSAVGSPSCHSSSMFLGQLVTVQDFYGFLLAIAVIDLSFNCHCHRVVVFACFCCFVAGRSFGSS